MNQKHITAGRIPDGNDRLPPALEPELKLPMTASRFRWKRIVVSREIARWLDGSVNKNVREELDCIRLCLW